VCKHDFSTVHIHATNSLYTAVVKNNRLNNGAGAVYYAK